MAKSDHVTCILQCREYNSRSLLRANQKIMRSLVCQKEAKFSKVWERHSHHPIFYESGKLYFDTYRTWFHVHGINGKPQKFFKLPSCTAQQKIEDCLIAQCMLSETCEENKGHRASFLALTAHNWLERYDLDTGQLLQRVYLSPWIKFRHLSFESGMESVVLKSTHQKMTQLARDAGVVHNRLMVLAVFYLFPLEFVGMMEITKAVFGKDITDAMITQNLLIVMHQGGYVRLYSFQQILLMGRKYRPVLYEPSSDNNGHFTGETPGGLPLNIKLTERPPVLFEVRCADHNLNLGGFPWHYIITPRGTQGRFHVCSLLNKKLAENGILDMELLAVEPDRCFFHHDESGRILHIGANEVRVLNILPIQPSADSSSSAHTTPSLPPGGSSCAQTTDTTVKHEIVEDFSVMCKIVEAQSSKPFDGVMYTSSGRVIKRKQSQDDDVMENTYEAVQNVDYENELDILTITAIQNMGDSYRGMLHLHDNHTGEHIKTITLDEPWAEGGSHTVTLDLDVLVHIVKSPMRRFSCFVYRLDRGMEDEHFIQRRRSRKGSFHVNFSPNRDVSGNTTATHVRRNTRHRARVVTETSRDSAGSSEAGHSQSSSSSHSSSALPSTSGEYSSHSQSSTDNLCHMKVEHDITKVVPLSSVPCHTGVVPDSSAVVSGSSVSCDTQVVYDGAQHHQAAALSRSISSSSSTVTVGESSTDSHDVYVDVCGDLPDGGSIGLRGVTSSNSPRSRPSSTSQSAKLVQRSADHSYNQHSKDGEDKIGSDVIF